MKKYFLILSSIIICLWNVSDAKSGTARIPEFSNDKVTVWKTIIYPAKEHQLKMHRHEHDRVVVALTDGLLQVTNDKGHSHLLTLKKDKAYFLKADKAGELHTDENKSGHLIKVMVIELH